MYVTIDETRTCLSLAVGSVRLCAVQVHHWPTLCSSNPSSTVASQVMQGAPPRTSPNAGLDKALANLIRSQKSDYDRYEAKRNLQATEQSPHELPNPPVSPRSASIFSHPRTDSYLIPTRFPLIAFAASSTLPASTCQKEETPR